MKESNENNLKNVLKTIKLQESTISMLLGVLVILVVGVFAIQYLAKNRTAEIAPPIAVENIDALPTTHIIKDGESLWSIAEQYYGTGYNWIDIKDANEITNPDAITDGQEISIPKVTPRIAQTEAEATIILEPTGKTVLAEASPVIIEAEENRDNEPKEMDTKIEHNVLVGENLWELAEKYYNDGNKWNEIAKANELDNPSVLASNQRIIIPNVNAAEIEEEAEQPIKDAQSDETKYTVEKGDSLWSIALDAYGDGNKWVEIAKANNLDKPSLIHSGNQLSIPR